MEVNNNPFAQEGSIDLIHYGKTTTRVWLIADGVSLVKLV
jgi:hypothetical protein